MRYEQAKPLVKEALVQSEQCQCPNCKVTLHASDCAVHNEPAYPKGACNCRAQPEQEPVAWQVEMFIDDAWVPLGNPQRDKTRAEALASNPSLPKERQRIFSLYTNPPQRTWVGLNGEEVNHFAAGCHLGNSVQDAIRKAEAKLKEKNTP